MKRNKICYICIEIFPDRTTNVYIRRGKLDNKSKQYPNQGYRNMHRLSNAIHWAYPKSLHFNAWPKDILSPAYIANNDPAAHAILFSLHIFF